MDYDRFLPLFPILGLCPTRLRDSFERPIRCLCECEWQAGDCGQGWGKTDGFGVQNLLKTRSGTT